MKNIEKNFKHMITTGDPKGLLEYVRDDLHDNVRAYYESVTECIIAVLESTFPTVFSILGNDRARLLMMDYIRDGNLPESGDMRFYGNNFAQWIMEADSNANTQKDLIGSSLLFDAAVYDFAINEVAYMDDYEPVGPDSFTGLVDDDYENLVFSFPKAFRLLSLANNIFDPADHNNNKIPQNQNQVFLVINRPSLDINVFSIERSQYLFLQALMAGKTFTSAYEMVVGCYPEFDVEGTLLDGINRGYFSSVQDIREIAEKTKVKEEK